MAHTFLLEIGLEEIPAHVVTPSSQQLVKKMTAFLEENRLDFDEIKAVIKDGKRFEVQMDDKRRNKLYGGWQKAVAATRYFE